MRLLRVWIALLLGAFIIVTRPVFAADEFRSDYTVDYYVNNQAGDISTNVEFSTKITNLQEDVYISSYQLSFPASFEISNIVASDDAGAVTPEVKTEDDTIFIKMKLNDPKNGQNTVNNLNLKFTQENLFEQNGNVWEVTVPTISGRENGSYSVRMHLPPNDKQISIAKPKPTRIQNNVIYWDNPTVKTIYAVFGDRQYYSLDLSYHLSNDKLYPVYTEIAFPPDTLYQKIVVDSVEPRPTSVRIDDDGNYLARYDLKPKEVASVRFRGSAEVFAEPRDEVRQSVKEQFNTQKGYLLKGSKYWSISSAASYKHLQTPEAVFKSVVGSLSYDHDKLSDAKSFRLGAELALKNPTKAVCSEFTDTFIALARANGIYAREIEGFGFSQDERLRPLSLVTDVLHAWPEYYDEESGLWKQVDPTWENTSGIDFFSSFDLDHVTFAIHGKDPLDPPPAGAYKLKNQDSRDVAVVVAQSAPRENESLTVNALDVAPVISDKRTYTGSVEIENTGNVTAYDIPVIFESGAFTISPESARIGEIPPLGKQKIGFSYKLKPGFTPQVASVTVRVNQQTSLSKTIRITPFTIAVTVGVSVAAALVLISIFLFFRLHKKH